MITIAIGTKELPEGESGPYKPLDFWQNRIDLDERFW
jgi:hypothetical protein